MSLLSPLALLFGLLALPILVLYMLRLRRKEVLVSSTLLWQRLLRDRQANTPWQKLRRNLLLFVQLLLLALLVLALARPAVPTPMVASGSIVVLLDASASMSATDVLPTRFAAASETAARLLDGLSDGAILAVIRVDGQPSLLVQARGASPAEKQAARRALESAQPGATPADWETAFGLAAATAANWQSPETTFVILSDGGLPGQGLPALPGTVRYLPVGNSDHNLAISAFSLRQIRPSSLQPELFARVTNYGSREQEAVLSIYLDDSLLSAVLLRLEAGESQSLSLSDLPARAGIYRAELRGKEEADNLALDDQAVAVYNPSQERRVLVASEEYFAQPAGTNIFLEQILAALPGITPYRVSPEAGEQTGSGFQIPDPASDPFDLYIFDGVLPTNPQTGAAQLPGGNLLLISPPDNPLLEQHGTFTPTLEVELSDHSLLQGLDWNWNKIYVAKARQIWLPTWGEAVLKDKGGMLLFIGQTGGRRVAVLTFDLNDSDLPLKVAFPLLFARLVDYLIPPQGTAAPDGLIPGEPLEIRYDPTHTIVEVVSPGGKVLSPRLTETGGWFSQTNEPGLYTVSYIIPGTGGKLRREPDHFAVNLFDPLESRIAPAATIQLGRSNLPPAQEAAVSQRELWRLPATLALGVLGVEWWLYHRPSFHLPLRRKDRQTP